MAERQRDLVSNQVYLDKQRMSGYGKRAEGIRYQEGSRSKRLPKGRAEMREPLQVLICSAPVEPGCTSHHRVLWYRLDWVSFDMDWGPLRSQCRHCCGAGGVEANPVSRPVGPGGWTGNLCSFIPFIEEQVLTCSPTLSYPASGPTEGPLCGWGTLFKSLWEDTASMTFTSSV